MILTVSKVYLDSNDINSFKSVFGFKILTVSKVFGFKILTVSKVYLDSNDINSFKSVFGFK